MEESVTFSEGDLKSSPDLRFLHFNDVYHVDPSSAEPCGGIARFQTVCNYYRHDDKFKDQPAMQVLFSGDAFNPSLESSVTKGSHMVPVLNNLGTDVACVGNHDLDFGVKQFRNLAAQCSFPWLLANVIDPALGDDVPLANAKKTVILTASNGIKVGVIGLVEREWLETINSLPPNLIYKSASATAKELVPALREQGAEIVIALTHQREPNDNKLAEKTPDGLIDVILGGHDHYYSHTILNGTHCLRSGSDFKQLSYVECRRRQDGSKKWDFHIIRRDIVKAIVPDPTMQGLSDKITASLASKLEKPLGYTITPLDARFTTVRLKESNIGNFVSDLMRFHYNGDCALMASGTIRGDQIYPPGVLRVKDLLNCFPFEDPCVVIKVTGKALLKALENSVSAYPALEGRFPQVSNISFEFEPTKPPDHRINWMTVAGQPLDHEKVYTLVTRGYMARGKDGFDSLLVESEGGTAKEIVHEENGILISMLLRQYFLSLKIMGQWRHWGKSMHKHWEGIHEGLHEAHPVVEPKARSGNGGVHDGATQAFPLQEKRVDVHKDTEHMELHEEASVHHHLDESDDEDEEMHPHVLDSAAKRERELHLIRKVIRKWWRLAGLKGHPSCCDTMDDGEFKVDWTRVSGDRINVLKSTLMTKGNCTKTGRQNTDGWWPCGYD